MCYLRKKQVLLLTILLGIMFLTVSAFAEGVNNQVNGDSVITGFESAAYETTVEKSNALTTLSISQYDVIGYNGGINVTIKLDKNAAGYIVAVYDIANSKTIRPTVSVTDTSSTTTINLSGSLMVNGNIYQLSIFKMNIDGEKSNTVTVYGMPSKAVSSITAQQKNKSVKLNSTYVSTSEGINYRIYDASTNDLVKSVRTTGTDTIIVADGLENGKLYYVNARPYKIYNNKFCWGPYANKDVYFVPMASPTNVKVYFSDKTTAVISCDEDETTDGIKVIYREAGGDFVSGCTKSGNSCSISKLSQKINYEFYLMKFKTVNDKKHFGSGAAIKYTAPTSGGLSYPQDPLISVVSGGLSFTITRKGDAKGISVVYREDEGAFKLACEAAGDTCTAKLDTSKGLTFYIMQYKTENGKKVYSPGIMVKNAYGPKNVNGSIDLSDYVVVNEMIDQNSLYGAIEGFMTEKDLADSQAFGEIDLDLLENYLDDDEIITPSADNSLSEDEKLLSMAFLSDALNDEEDEFDVVPEEFRTGEEYDEYKPTEADYIYVPVAGISQDDPAQKGLGITSGDVEPEGITFYRLDSEFEQYPYAPSFMNR